MIGYKRRDERNVLDAMVGYQPQESVEPEQKEPKRTFTDKALSLVTMGHVGGEQGPEEEVKFTPQGAMTKANVPTGDPGFFQDPVTALAMGGVAGVRAASQPLLTAGREALGWFTGGASEVPALAKAGVQGAAKIASAKPLAEAVTKRQAGPSVLQSVTPEAKVAATVLDDMVKPVVQATPKAVTPQVTPEPPPIIEVKPKQPPRVDQFREAVNIDPVYSAIDQIVKDGGLNLDILAKDYGKETLSELRRRRMGLVTKAGKLSIDDVATQYGYESGDELVNAITGSKSIKAATKQQREAYNTQFSDQYELERKGFTPVEKGGIVAADLNKGDQLRIKGETYKVKGERQGNVIIEDGDKLSVDVFDTVPADMIKRKLSKGTLDELRETYVKNQQRGSVTLPELPKSTLSFDVPEVEARFQAANGLQKPTIWEQAREGVGNLWTKFSREYEALPKNKEFAQLRFDLKSLEKQKNVAKDTAIRSIGEITATLDKAGYDVFRRKVILDDLAGEAAKGRSLPYGFTPETLAAAKNKVDIVTSLDPNVQAALAKRKQAWDGLKGSYTEAMQRIGFDVSDRLLNEDYFRHQVLEYAKLDGIFGTGKRLKTPASRSFLKKREGSALDINSDYLQAEYQVMGQMYHDIKVADTIAKIGQKYNIKPKVMQDAKINKLENWKDAIPEGYTTWQPREGNVFYMADSVPAKLAKDIQEGIVTEITGDDLSKVMAIGKKRQEWVVKNEVADTLNEVVRQKDHGAFGQADKKILGAWKEWQLISPRRAVKYNLRNLSGDAEATFVGNPHAFTKTPRAVKEIYSVFARKKPMSPEMKDWFDRGGMSSTLQAQEMNDMKSLWMFTNLYEKSGKVSDIPGKAWSKYWNAARMTTDAREATLRYSAYLDYLEQMKANNGVPKNFGASMPEEIMGLPDIKDRAFWLSNDLLGAYDRVSVGGQFLREHVIPFWSWQEVNMKRYKNLFRNAANNGQLVTTIGRKLGAATPMAALKVGKLVLGASAFAAATQVYNHTFFHDEEQELPSDVRAKPHLVLGRDADGKVQYFSRLGILGDALDWFGVDGVQKEVREYLNGHKTIKEAALGTAAEFAKGPVNVVQRGAMPFAKLALETATQRSTFPDVFHPRTVRDRGEYLARAFGMEHEYKAITGKPTEGYGKSLPKVFIYSIDPGEAAYRDVADLKREYMKKLGKGSEGFWLSPKGDALYNMKLAIRYKDRDAEKVYFKKYMELGGNEKGSDKSLDRMEPLSGMSKADRWTFEQQLSQEDRQKLQRARQFYETTLRGNR